MPHKVYVVGIGMVTSGGLNSDQTWESVVKGSICSGPMPKEFAPDVTPVVCYPVRGLRRGVEALATRAAGEAIWDAKQLTPDALCVGSTSAGFSDAASIAIEDLERTGFASETSIPACGFLASNLAQAMNLHPARVFQFSSACAASSLAICSAYRMVQSGSSQICLAGGADELTAPVVWMFDRARVYANELKPFDRDRKGVVLADGAAFLVLCNEAVLVASHLTPYCEIIGVGMNSDAYDAAAPSWSGISACIGKVQTSYDFVCGHGTGTKLNDSSEALALVDRLGSTGYYVSSYKGALGHPQGASGAVGVGLTANCIRHQTIFGTAGLDNQDPDIALTIPKQSFDARIDNALVLSYGSWGANAAIALRRCI